VRALAPITVACALGLAAGCATQPAAPPAGAAAAAPTLERQALNHVERIRAIKPGADARQAAEYNKQLEEAWKFFLANRTPSLAVLRRELAAELKKAPAARNDFVLLDVGYFLHVHGEPADRGPARDALFTLDTAAEILRWNQQELFEFAQVVAVARDPRILGFVEKTFMRGKIAVRMPAQGLMLDETAASVFLYGAYGAEAEGHLRKLLADPAVLHRALDVLMWIGTPDSNVDVRAAMARDYESFVRGATFLMGMGGPQGRFFLLQSPPRSPDARIQEYYAKIRPVAQAANFAELRKVITAAGGSTTVLESDTPRDALVAELLGQRSRLLRTVSRESFEEVRRLNVLINALRYREQ
jgi:hypothetical protein